MRKLIALALLLTLGMAQVSWADGINQVVSTTTVNPQWIVTVFNDAGSALTSGTTVVWDNDDTEFDRSGYPYVTVSSSGTVDSPWTAGVILDGSCPDQALCSIVVYGPAKTNMRGTFAEDTLVGTGSVADGVADDYGTGANTCALGTLMEDRNIETGGAFSGVTGNPLVQEWVFVDIDCN